MMTSGTKTKKHITTLLLLLSVGLSPIYAQSDDVLAKSYFLKAQEAYNKGNNINALEHLDKTLEYLGNTNPKVEALYVKIGLQQKDYTNAEKHLSSYFDVADEGHSDYMQMLGYVAEVKEKIAEKKAKEAEYKLKREQKLYDEVVAYFQNNSQLCCSDYLERETLNIDWSSAKRALQSVVVKDMYGSSIKNDTLFQTASNINIPLSEFKDMEFEVSEAKPNTFSITSSKLTLRSIYGPKVDIYVEGRLNPTFVKNVKETLLKVAQQKRVIKYLREHPGKFPEKNQLLNEQSYLFAYGDRKEYNIDFPEGQNEKLESENKASKNTEPLKDRPSSFPGGKTALLQYFSENIQYPEEAKASQVEGKVYVTFTVLKDGSLREIKAIKGPGFGLNKEAVRLLKNMPKWNPAIEQGKMVASKISIPLNFELPKDSITKEETALDRWGRSVSMLNRTKKEENWNTLNQNGYKIDYPKNWTMNNNVPNAEFVLTSLDRYGRNGNAAIRMESGAVSDDMSLSSYATTYIDGFLKVQFNSVKILENETKKNNNYTFQKIKSSLKTNENLEIIILTQIIIENGKLYLISFVSKVDEFNEHQPTVDKILSSFTI